MKQNTDTIVALATAQGGALGVIRLSGEDAISIADKVFKPLSKKMLQNLPSHTVHLGNFYAQGEILDECLATIFKGSRSYTGEPVVEFSCHGSPYIQTQMINTLLGAGARLAKAGEFTQRAFLHGKMDLSQAEAVADLIASESQAAHSIAMKQMRGGFAQEIVQLRAELLDFASLIELELDFAEEDVAFADRQKLQSLLTEIERVLVNLTSSFSLGNAIKHGVPVAIVGKPNAGKSTLLNALLNEERAIVSDVAGTTRDTIEENLVIEGISFKFIDTAGIRQTIDKIEEIGVQKAKEKMQQAKIILYLFDENDNTPQEVISFVKDHHNPTVTFILLKSKAYEQEKPSPFDDEIRQSLLPLYAQSFIAIAAKEGKNITALKQELLGVIKAQPYQSSNTIVSNARHYEVLSKALEEVRKIQEGINLGLSADFLAIDIRQGLFYLGEITGEVTNDEILRNIFGKFCIGK